MPELMHDEAGRLFELLDLARAHHDPADERRADLAFVSNQIQGQSNGVGAIIGAILSNPEVIKALMGLLFKAGKSEAPAPAVPAAPSAPQITSVELRLGSIVGPARTGSQAVQYRLLEDGTIQLVGDTTSLDDKSTLWLDAGVIGPTGGVRIDLDPANTPAGEVNHPELLGKVAYIAEDAETGEELGRIGGKGLDDLGHVENGVSFVPNRYAESGGMAANARIKRKGGPIRIYAELGDVESNGFVTPEVR